MEKLFQLLDLEKVDVVFIWDLEKNEKLKRSPDRNFKGFEDIVLAILEDRILDILENKNYPNQYILVVEMDNYVYAVPLQLELEKLEENYILFLTLKTLYPSRKLYKKYKTKGDKHG